MLQSKVRQTILRIFLLYSVLMTPASQENKVLMTNYFDLEYSSEPHHHHPSAFILIMFFQVICLLQLECFGNVDFVTKQFPYHMCSNKVGLCTAQN